MSTTEHLNLPTYEQMEEHNRILSLIAGKGASDAVLDSIITAQANGENTTRLFWSWYTQALAAQETENRYDLLCRFFSALAKAYAGKTYTLRSYNASASGDPAMTPIDDLDGKTASPLCTDSDSDTYHWMDEDPLYWYIRAQALSLSDGTMNITCIEGENGFDETGESAPVYVFKMARWKREWTDGTYDYISWRSTQAAGYRPYAGDVAPDNTKRAIMWQPAYGGGLNSAGALTSGTGRKAYIRAAATTGITKARLMTAYEGLWGDTDTEFLLHDWQFRHFNKENTGLANGCVNYSYQYTVAAAESDVRRVLLTAANAENILERSSVMIGTHSTGASNDRGTAENYDIADCVQVLSKQTVTINGTDYVALNLDLDADITVPATALVSTAPWHSGETDRLPGHKDGCTVSLTGSKTPLRVGGVEVLDGAYSIGLDPLYQVTANSESGYDYAVYEVRDSENQAGSVTANYEDTGILYEGMAGGWNYVKSFVSNLLGIVFPKTVGGSSTTYYKSAFSGSGSAGARAPWRFGRLISGGSAGLACESGSVAPSSAAWYGRPRLSGRGKKRGEWAA